MNFSWDEHSRTRQNRLIVLVIVCMAALVLAYTYGGNESEPEPVHTPGRSHTTSTSTSISTTTSTTSTTEPEELEAIRAAVRPETPEPVPDTTTTTEQPHTYKEAAIGTCFGYVDLVASYFPQEQVSNACAVLGCESEGVTTAVSHTNDHGLMQINARYHADNFGKVTGVSFWEGVYVPEHNVHYAYVLWSEQGWQPWSCRRVL